MGKDLRKVVIVDNIRETFYKHEENGIEIKSWYDCKEDREIPKLEKVLDKLLRLEDVRVGIN